MQIRKRLIVVHREGDDGKIGFLAGVFLSREEAALSAGAYLRARETVSNADGNRLASLLWQETEPGEEEPIVTNTETGLQFRILEADFTSDGAPIMPGMRVIDYDRELGTVVPEQFMSGGMSDPGGRFFKESGCWYDVRRDVDDYVKTFNGERLKRP